MSFFLLCGGSLVQSSLFFSEFAYLCMRTSTCLDFVTPNSARPSQRPRHSTPTMSSSPCTSSWSLLQKTLWTGPWQRRQTTRTTRPCQTRRLSQTRQRLRRLHARCELGALHRIVHGVRRWTALMSHTKKLLLASDHIVFSVVSRVRCPVCLCSVCLAQAPRQ